MNKTNIPTQLFVGDKETLENETEFFLQQNLCLENNGKDCYCNDCRKIKNRQHENVIFINPEKTYSVSDLDIIFETVFLGLENNQKFFFILQKAQNLSLSTSNKLLKVLEEPPTGYNFILHTNNKNLMLPTIVSRCFIKVFKESDDSNNDHLILSFFYEQKFNHPQEFDKAFKNINPSDGQSAELLDNMLNYYSQKIIFLNKGQGSTNLSNNLDFYNSILCFLKNKLNKLPQSGSSKIFWKNLYINFPQKRFIN